MRERAQGAPPRRGARWRRRSVALALGLVFGVTGGSGGGGVVVGGAARASASEPAGLLLGEHRLTAVTDGDTIKVEGLDAAVRLLGVDTEETFKSRADRRLLEAGWSAYLVAKRGGSPRPVKMATPLGEEARRFAAEFFAGSPTVRLERDDPREGRDAHGRHLAYAFAWQGGRWVNYSVECVRAGMSPYFTKYGYSRRFHEELERAESEARAAGRGIWASGAMHYPDYPERKAWWNARADFLRRALGPATGGAARDASALDGGDAPHRPVAPVIDLRQDHAPERLADLDGKEATVVGLVARIAAPAPGGGGPWRVTLGPPHGPGFPLIFFDGRVLAAAGLEQAVGEFVAARGVVSRYRHADGGHEWQMIIRRSSQLVGSSIEPGGEPRAHGSGAPAARAIPEGAARVPSSDAPDPPRGVPGPRPLP